MHVPLTALLLSMTVGEASVEVVSLDGRTRVGLLQQLTATDVRIVVDRQEVVLAAGELQALRFPQAEAAQEYDKENRAAVDLVDGSRIYCTSLVADPGTMTLQSPVAGEISLPLTQVKSVRLAAWESSIDEDWQELRQRESRQDLLIVRKGDDLDFAGGVVGKIGEETVTVLLGERELEVPRERVFGFVFPREPLEQDAAVCALQSEADDQFRLHSIEMRDDAFAGTLRGGTEVLIPVDRVQLIDFGLGRIRYLTDLEPAASYEAVGAIREEYVLKYKRVEYDNDRLYPHLIVGSRTFRRGLWIHSGTVLRYRLNRDFRRLQAVMGINRSSHFCGQLDPRVRVQLTADGRAILDEVVAWSDEERALDIDVEGVRDLEIRVSSAEEQPLGICEHLALAEARLIR